MPKIVITVLKESSVNLNKLDKTPVYIKIKGRIEVIVIPTTRGIERAGDLKSGREERIDSIRTNSAKTESTNHPVWKSAILAFLYI